jgi:hypothetical protein
MTETRLGSICIQRAPVYLDLGRWWLRSVPAVPSRPFFPGPIFFWLLLVGAGAAHSRSNQPPPSVCLLPEKESCPVSACRAACLASRLFPWSPTPSRQLSRRKRNHACDRAGSCASIFASYLLFSVAQIKKLEKVCERWVGSRAALPCQLPYLPSRSCRRPCGQRNTI